jgi:hypothetical protein
MIKHTPLYWLVCDAYGCDITSAPDNDSVAWDSAEGALEDATAMGWKNTKDGRHYCWRHARQQPA